MRGGYRRRHTLPKLSPEQVRWAREQRAAGQPIKRLMLTLGVSDNTVWRALAGLGPYKGIDGGEV